MAEAKRARRRFTAEEILRMVAAGILREDEPVELIDGELLEMSPQGPLHRARTVAIHQLLERVFGPGHHVQDHSPVDAGPSSLPEPDVAVVLGEPADYETRHPSGPDVPLVCEISVTSQLDDRAKASTYAAGGFASYWNLDVPARRLTVYTEPRTDLAEYSTIHIYTDRDSLSVAGGVVQVAELLPGPERGPAA